MKKLIFYILLSLFSIELFAVKIKKIASNKLIFKSKNFKIYKKDNNYIFEGDANKAKEFLIKQYVEESEYEDFFNIDKLDNETLNKLILGRATFFLNKIEEIKTGINQEDLLNKLNKFQEKITELYIKTTEKEIQKLEWIYENNCTIQCFIDKNKALNNIFNRQKKRKTDLFEKEIDTYNALINYFNSL